MKKILLPLFIVATAGTAFGQTGVKHSAGILSFENKGSVVGTKPLSGAAAKSTAISDTMYYYNNTDSLLFESAVALKYGGNTGYVFGTNTYEDNAFAEMYDFTWGQDTAINILGVISSWAGYVSPSSTDSVTMQVWGLDTTRYQLDTNTYAWNFPGSSLGEKKVILTALDLGLNQLTTTWFDAPVNSINTNFYVGYSFNPISSNGDSIGLRSTADSLGTGIGQYEVIDSNTLLTTRNAVRAADGFWYDAYNDYGYKVNLSLVPVFELTNATGVHRVSKKGLSLLGNWPNPAVNSTNIHFALQQPASVTIQVTDLNGKVFNTLEQNSLSTGSHTMTLDLSGYPAGNYVYILRTSNGIAMASLFSIVK